MYEYESISDQSSWKNFCINFKCQIQSAVETYIPIEVPVILDSNLEEQNVDFLDNDEGECSNFQPISDMSFLNDYRSDVDLANYLQRPVLIKTINWNQGGSPDQTFTPWSLFFSDSRIASKLNNYAFINCNLNVKFVINASPFYYGAIIASYQPLPYLNGNNLFNVNTRYIPISQRPHIWMYPQTSSGGEMILPYFATTNYLNATQLSAFSDMGEIAIRQYTALQSANGAVGSGVTIQVYAWASNVKLAGPTSSLAVQSKVQVDEYGNSPISGPATAVAKFADSLSKVPIIGPYAKATSIGANAVSAAAKLFGYTDVPVIDNCLPVKDMPFRGLASAHISEPTEKLLLDPKGELTIDPRTTGLDGTDELAVRNIVTRESFLTSFDWTTTQALDSLMFYSGVSPNLQDIGTISAAGTYTVGLTPMAHLAQLFHSWRGDIIFRFRFICSKYHKGRVRVTWDPVGNLFANTVTTSVCYTKIVDLGESTDVEFVVPYLQIKAWQSITYSGALMGNFWQTGSFSLLSESPLFNGTLTVRVLTTLSAPIATSTISCLVFVRGAENLEFADPIDPSKAWSYFSVQSQIQTDKPPNDRYLLNFGENIASVRTLMRRAVQVDSTILGTVTDTNRFTAVAYAMHKFPPTPGYDPNGKSTVFGLVTPASQFRYSFCNWTPMSWMQSCFVGMRGAMKWHFNLDVAGNNLVQTFNLHRSISTITNDPILTFSIPVATTSQNSINQYLAGVTSGGISGKILTNTETQSSLSCELPHINSYRFVSASPTKNILGNNIDDSQRESYFVGSAYKPIGTNSTPQNAILERICSIGTDFNLFFYLNAPHLTYNGSAIVPV